MHSHYDLPEIHPPPPPPPEKKMKLILLNWAAPQVLGRHAADTLTVSRATNGRVLVTHFCYSKTSTPMVGHLFQNYDTIYVRFFPTYTFNHSCYTIYVRFFYVYLRFIPKYMTIFLQTRIYMRTKKPIYMRCKQACGIWGDRRSSYKRHRIIWSAKKPFMYDGAEK